MDIQRDKALIVDDDEAVLSILCKALNTSGIDAFPVQNGADAINSLLSDSYDIILMDINMPGMDGFQTIKQIRKCAIETPIIIVSGRKEDLDTLYGLDIGADDYVTKPFNPVTLGAKAKALIRRSRSSTNRDSEAIITVGPFSYNTSTLRFYKEGVEVPLTSKENAIIKLFIDNVNRIFTKSMIYEMVWDNSVSDDTTIMVYINRLRQKIEDDPANPKYIQTIRGLGYTFVV